MHVIVLVYKSDTKARLIGRDAFSCMFLKIKIEILVVALLMYISILAFFM